VEVIALFFIACVLLGLLVLALASFVALRYRERMEEDQE
jgi:hypothetical protein